MQKITSRENQKLKNAVKVRDGKNRELVFIEGLRLTEEVLRSDLIISEAFFDERFGNDVRGKVLIEKISTKTTNLFEVSSKILNNIADTNQSQGIILIAHRPQTAKSRIESNLKNNSSALSSVIFLHEINNPSNLGAILRTAEAVDIAGVIVSTNSADVFSAKAIRSAMGASFRLPIWENADFDKVLDWAKVQNLTSIAADINAEKSYYEIDWKIPRLLIFGSEAHGLSEELRNKIDELTFIPMENNVESLNLAVSCGIILFSAKCKVQSAK